MAIKLSSDEIAKRPAEVRKVDFDWTESKDLASGETLSAVSGTPAAVPTGDANDLSVESPTVSGTKGQVILKKGRTPITVTADKTTDKLTATAHGLGNGARIHIIGCSPPDGIDEKTQYFVISSTANDFQLALCEGGTAIDLTSNGSGTLKIGIDYLISFAATTSNGQTLEAQGICKVRD